MLPLLFHFTVVSELIPWLLFIGQKEAVIELDFMKSWFSLNFE
jgi:hypothetical protein